MSKFKFKVSMFKRRMKFRVQDVLWRLFRVGECTECDEITVCPYCGSEASGLGCCGESSMHFEAVRIRPNGEECQCERAA